MLGGMGQPMRPPSTCSISKAQPPGAAVPNSPPPRRGDAVAARRIHQLPVPTLCWGASGCSHCSVPLSSQCPYSEPRPLSRAIHQHDGPAGGEADDGVVWPRSPPCASPTRATGPEEAVVGSSRLPGRRFELVTTK